MKISIVVPSYNHAQYLPATLDSLLGQRGISPEQREIIVIDGGSKDGTFEILKKYDHHLTKWVSEKDSGQTNALNKGFSMASGDILGWLCSDDLLEPYTLSEVFDVFKNHPERQWLYGDAELIDRNGKFLRWKKEIPFSWFVWTYDHNYLPQPSTFWRRTVFDAVGRMDESFNLAMDADLWARLAQKGKPLHVRRLWSKMRIYEEQKTQRLRIESLNEDRIIRNRVAIYPTSDLAYSLMKPFARVTRISWKLATGCYW